MDLAVPHRSFVRRGTKSGLAFVLCLSIGSVGCSTVTNQAPAGDPFAAFIASAVQLRIGTDKALAATEKASADRFLEEAAVDPRRALALKFRVDPDHPFEWHRPAEGTPPLPLFFKVEKFRDAANDSTASFLQYARLLGQLASPELIPRESFNTLAADLNTNTSDAVVALTGAPGDAQGVALFTTLAVEAAHVYLQSRRAADLVKLVEKNQAAVERFAGHMQRAARITALAAINEYGPESEALLRSIAGTTENPNPSPAQRRKAVEALIALDRRFIQQIDVLQALHRAFGQIPSAHAELPRAIRNPQVSLKGVIALVEEGKRLEGQYDRALSVNLIKAAEATASKADALADRLEAQAEAARVRAEQAAARIADARAAADADPADAEKRARVEQIEASRQRFTALAQDLLERAAQERANAETARQETEALRAQR